MSLFDPCCRAVRRRHRVALGVLLLVGTWWCAPADAGEAIRTTPVLDAAPIDASRSDAERALLSEIRSVGRRGFLYAVTRDDATGVSRASTLYLYGTIHLGAAGSEPFNGPLLDALARSRRLAIEADPSDAANVQRLAASLGRYDAGDNLRRHVPPDVMTRLTAFGQRHRLSIDEVVRFKPWLLANMVVLTDLGHAGLEASMGSEMYLAGFARETGLPIVEIEGLEAQLRLLSDMPDALQAAQLDEALAENDNGVAHEQSRALFALWRSGDAASGDALIASMRRDAEGKAFERYFFDTLIDARNAAMADRAEALMREPGDTLFAVGALHLFGGTGLLREFVRRGYRVADLQTDRTVDR